MITMNTNDTVKVLFQCDIYIVVRIVLCFGVEYSCCLHPMYGFIF